MKALLALVVTVGVLGQVYANDTIQILNTVFHGINTFLNITRPTQVVVTQPTVVPAQSVVVTTQPTVATTVTPTPQIYYVNDQTMIIQNGVYVPYVVPYGHRYVRHPAPPKHHYRHSLPGRRQRGGHRR